MRLSIFSIVLGLVLFGHPIMSLRAAPPDTLQRASIQRVYSGQPKQLTALQFKDPATGKVVNTVNIQQYDPFRYNLPREYVDTTQVVYQISDETDLPADILQEYHQKFGKNALGTFGKGKWICHSSRRHWILILYTASLSQREFGPLIERSKLTVFSPTGKLHWELPVFNALIYWQTAYSEDDSLFAYIYIPSKEVDSEFAQGIQILNLFTKKVFTDYQPPTGWAIVGHPTYIGDHKFVVHEVGGYSSGAITVFDCEKHLIYRKTSSRYNLRRFLKIMQDGVLYRQSDGDTVLLHYPSNFVKYQM